ncbi:MAG: transcriptional regulator [Bryobacteraceae bacterium]|jgi:HTH-type transcriptional regulator/antitoxin HigA
MDDMSTGMVDLDTKRYGRLLAKALPAVIKSEDENDRVLAIIEGLLAKGERNLTAEEEALLELLTDLAHDFEEQHYPLPSVPPNQMVAFLLEQRGLKSTALWPVVGSKGRVSEILSGKRAISKDQAKKLAAFFHVGADLFI